MKFNFIDSWSFCCYLITDKGLIVPISEQILFYTIFAQFKSSYETGKSVTGGKGENPEKTTWHTHKHDLVCVTCDCRLINWAATYGEVIGCCQSDIACLNQFT